MTTRVFSGILLLPLLLTILIKGLPLYVLGFIITIVAINEFTKALSVKNIKTFPILGYLLSTFFFIKNIFNVDIKYLIIVSFISVIVSLVLTIFIYNKDIKSLVINLIGILYIIWGFDAIVSIIDTFKDGDIYVWLIFITSSLSDTMAYFVGSFFGKHKLAPKLSPKKTIEGSLGAIFFSTIACLIFGIIFSLNIPMLIVIGITGSIVSQIGDLLASFVKRYVGIKDYGNLIPGHGGVLDRCDSIILVSQYIYMLLYIIQKF